VIDVRLDTKEISHFRASRVHVDINLNQPLKSGHLICINGKKFWLDFRYECLPHFCFSYGRLGHYAAYCQEIPFTEAKMEGKEQMAFGQWLRAEVREHSPYWLTFYYNPKKSKGTEDEIPETPPSLIPKTLALPPTEAPSRLAGIDGQQAGPSSRSEKALAIS